MQHLIDEIRARRSMETLCVAAVESLLRSTERAYRAALDDLELAPDDPDLRRRARLAGTDARLMGRRPHGRVLPAWFRAKIEEA